MFKEFCDKPELYATVADLYREYYVKLENKKRGKSRGKVGVKEGESRGKFEVKRQVKIPNSFYALTRGFDKRRAERIKRISEKKENEIVKQEVSDRNAELRKYALSPQRYVEDFKTVREFNTGIMQILSLKLRNAFEQASVARNIVEGKLKMGEQPTPEEFAAAEPKIELTKNEDTLLRSMWIAYRHTYETMRTAYELPIRYNVNIEDRSDKKSIGGFIAELNELLKNKNNFKKGTLQLKDFKMKREDAKRHFTTQNPDRD